MVATIGEIACDRKVDVLIVFPWAKTPKVKMSGIAISPGHERAYERHLLCAFPRVLKSGHPLPSADMQSPQLGGRRLKTLPTIGYENRCSKHSGDTRPIGVGHIHSLRRSP